jgi:metal-responsive CopG/Arc/MetJ family transcriptional regulator
MSDTSSKRLSLLVPKELYDRFIEFSQKEYKTTTTQITDFMVEYVKEREIESERAKQDAMLSTLSRCGAMIYRAIQEEKVDTNIHNNLVAIAEFMLEASKNASIFENSDYLSKLIALERKI